MFVPEHVLNNVFFLCQETDDKESKKRPVATGFFVSRHETIQSVKAELVYFVTARHVLEGLDRPTHLRVNRADKDAFIDVPLETTGWHKSDEADVAAHPGVFRMMDGVTGIIRIATARSERFIPKELTFTFEDDKTGKGCPVSVGDRLISPGLFSQDHGESQGKNLPIVRFGHVSRMPTEMHTQVFADSTMKSDAYLAEFLSWGGMSGSPVLLYREYTTATARLEALETQTIAKTRAAMPVLGLVHGHSDIITSAEGRYHEAESDQLKKVSIKVNSGIAIIVPAHYITALLDQEDVAAERQAMLENAVTKGISTATKSPPS